MIDYCMVKAKIWDDKVRRVLHTTASLEISNPKIKL